MKPRRQRVRRARSRQANSQLALDFDFGFPARIGAQPTLSRAAVPRPTALDLSAAMHRTAEHLIRHVPELRHVDPEALAISFSYSRRRGRHGAHARCVATRFPGGRREGLIDGARYRGDRVRVQGREVLYVLYFMLPRFWEETFPEKIATIIHELYHIHPAGDGSLRRFPGRNHAHGGSQKTYHARMREMAELYLLQHEDGEHLDFIRSSLADLEARHGRLTMLSIRQPRFRPVD